MDQADDFRRLQPLGVAVSYLLEQRCTTRLDNDGQRNHINTPRHPRGVLAIRSTPRSTSAGATHSGESIQDEV
jgi:hypothetical protein